MRPPLLAGTSSSTSIGRRLSRGPPFLGRPSARPLPSPHPSPRSSPTSSRPMHTSPALDENPAPPRKKPSPIPAPPRKKPSPYRLLAPTAFVTAFRPLHLQGWRLLPLKHSDTGEGDDGLGRISEGSGDLQGRRLVRVLRCRTWAAEDGVAGFVRRLGVVVDQLDHHPSVRILPSIDYDSPSPDLLSDTSDLGGSTILEISTHTHTPLPPLPLSKGEGDPMRPGVTGKDLSLADRVEEMIQEWIA